MNKTAIKRFDGCFVFEVFVIARHEAICELNHEAVYKSRIVNIYSNCFTTHKQVLPDSTRHCFVPRNDMCSLLRKHKTISVLLRVVRASMGSISKQEKPIIIWKADV